MYTIEDLSQSRWRQEITSDADYPLHTYVTRGTKLVGYVSRKTGELTVFTKPKTAWAVTRRQFRELSKTEIKNYLEVYQK